MISTTRFLRCGRVAALLGFFFVLGCTVPQMQPSTQEITLIHMGDIHGHMVPRPNLRSDGKAQVAEGGLARMYTRIGEIRSANPNHLLINTGDTVQGSAEALFTKGQALINVLNRFAIDAYAPGNWEFVYGTQRFLDMFAGQTPAAPWNTIAANVFYEGEPYADKTGQRVLPPYSIKTVGGVRVGILGMTTDRGPQIVGRSVTRGFRYLRTAKRADEALSEVDAEVKRQVEHLRNVEKVAVLVMASELGLANNVRIADAIAGIDVILSSDMHEQTTQPVLSKNGTLIVEQGQDGTRLGQVNLTLEAGQVKSKRFVSHAITSQIAENREIASLVAAQRAPFVAGQNFNARMVNPFNGSNLKLPIDTIVGQTTGALYRGNFSHEPMPGAIEGSSHNMLADAFRQAGAADIGAIRGFRYGTHVAPGPVRYEDLYHFVAIGPQIGVGKIKGQQLKEQIEAAADGSLNPDVSQWTGGWLFGFSGVTMDFDPYAARGSRASNIRVNGSALDAAREYSYASYWYAADPAQVNGLPVSEARVIKGADGSAMDGTEVVARYIESLPNKTIGPVGSRIKLLNALPAAQNGFNEVQPIRGAKR
jgi:S-sulfosulfanyl-L-cysteine sulfohydrolase